MRRLSLVVGIVALTALACSDPTSQIPTSPSAPAVTAVEIGGPSSIAPGQAVQLVANIRLADGTIKLPSPSTPVQWFSSNTSVLRVSSTGLATGQQVGDAQIFLVHGTGPTQRQATKEFVVVPDGTYRLVGTIFEADFPTVPVINARVTVTPGSLTTLTGFDGRYKLFGVPPNAVVTVMKFGYTTISEGIQLSSHTNRNFNLPLTGTRLVIAGPYKLTIDFSGSCSSSNPLSPPLRLRTYDAVISQNGPEISVVLTEARFRTNPIGRGNKFVGRADSDGATFWLDPFDAYYYPYGQIYYPNVAERLSDNTILVPQGSATTTGSAAGLSGSMQGWIDHWDARFPNFNMIHLGYCASSAQFTLTPR
jgi:hypothetical protein